MNSLNASGTSNTLKLIVIIITVVLLLLAGYFAYTVIMGEKAPTNNTGVLKLDANQFREYTEPLITYLVLQNQEITNVDLTKLNDVEVFYTTMNIIVYGGSKKYTTGQYVPASEVKVVAAKYFGKTDYAYTDTDENFNYNAAKKDYQILTATGLERLTATYKVEDVVYDNSDFTFKLTVDWGEESDSYFYTVKGTCDTKNCLIKSMVIPS